MADKDQFQMWSADPAEGIEVNTSDFAPEFGYLWDTYNLTNGINLGIGPVYGMSLIPGHNSNVTQATNETPGLVQSESATAPYGLSSRQGIVAIFPVKMTNPTGFASQGTFWAFVIWRRVSSVNYYDVVFSSTFNGTRWAYSTDLSQGLHVDLVTQTPAYGWQVELCNATSSTSKTSGAQDMLESGNTSDFNTPATAIIMSVSGPDIPAPWLLCKAVNGATGGLTTAPSGSFQGFVGVGSAQSWIMFTSAPAEWNLATYARKKRRAVVTCLLTTGEVNMIYNTDSFNPASVFAAQAYYESTETHINLSGITATKVYGTTAYTSNAILLYNDTAAKIASSYKAILNAAGKPQCWIIQDWAVSIDGVLPQAVDLTDINYEPQTLDTLSYEDDGKKRNTAFYRWPAYPAALDIGTYPNGPFLNGAGTGVLRFGTDYELTYSVFNKRLNYESNVGRSVKFSGSTTDDFTSLTIFRDTGDRTAILRFSSASSGTRPVIPYPAGSSVLSGDLNWDINNLQYRFYYRPIGTFQWLPAGNIDAPQFWYQGGSSETTVTLCANPVAGLPGGQPGGFTDYSNLPQDKYDCVVQYKNRAFWFSAKACYFSLRNNILAYPGRNSIAAVTGDFKGGIVHNYPGQAEQNSRLIVFGTKETYVGRFTGQPILSPVQVSPDTIGEYPLDGSDFVLDPWTSITAFSHRSAVVADGILYWWGPQGVFRDDGVQTPTKISLDLEPDIFGLIEPQFGDAVMGHYNSRTKELMWVYTPKGVTTQQNYHAIIYDLKALRWRRRVFQSTASINRMFDLDVTTSDDAYSGVPTSARTVAVAWQTDQSKQRAYFYDQNNRAGDLYPTAEYVVSSVTYPSADHTLIRFDADPVSTTKIAACAVGDLVSVQANQISSAWGSATNAIGVIEEKSGTSYITVRFTSADVVAPLVVGTIAKKYRFPLFIESASLSNAFPWKLSTAYWMPGGTNYWAYWRYFYFMFLYTKWDGPDAEFTFEYRTPVSPSNEVETLTLADNSDGNSQIYHPLTVGNMNAEGQALKITMSGSHIGHQWVLQYLEAHTQAIEGDHLKMFEQ